MEPVPAVTTFVVVVVCLFIAIDITTIGGIGPGQDVYILRIELVSDVHDNLGGTLTFEIADGIYEQLQIDNSLRFVFTTKYYRGTYALSFDGEGVTFGPISVSIQNAGTVYNGEVNYVTVKIDAVEG